MDLNKLADDIIAGRSITPEEALAVLQLPDAETLALVAAAGRVRRHHFGTTMKVNYLVNLKSGLCPEDCFYCSQRLGSQADILKYRWLRNEDAVAAAKAGIAGGCVWWRAAAGHPTATSTRWPKSSGRSRPSTRMWKSAPASDSSGRGSQNGWPPRGQTPTTTT